MGPSSWSDEAIEKLIDAGMSVACLNFSSGTYTEHVQVLHRVREAEAITGSAVAVCMDTRGPNLCTGALSGHQRLNLKVGQEVAVIAEADFGSFEGSQDPRTGDARFAIQFEGLCELLKPGSSILISRGRIALSVTHITNSKELKAVVNRADTPLGEHQQVLLPGATLSCPVLSDRGLKDLKEFACKHQLDYVAASYIQAAEDVRYVRRMLVEYGGPRIQVIAKIENETGLRNINEILKETDGVWLSRDTLALEMLPCKLALAQKLVTAKAAAAGKFAIVAGGMVASMVDAAHPTCAEMADMANAVYDGVDAIMLGRTTAVGKHPTAAVAAVSAALCTAEAGVDAKQMQSFVRKLTIGPITDMEAVVSGAVTTASNTRAGLVVVVSQTDDVARLVAKYKLGVPVLVVTDSPQVVHHCNGVYALFPFQVGKLPMGLTVELDMVLGRALQYAVERKLCAASAPVVLLTDYFDPLLLSLPVVAMRVAPGLPAMVESSMQPSPFRWPQTTAISLSNTLSSDLPARKTKIACIMAHPPASDETLSQLLAAGMDVACFALARADVPSLQKAIQNFYTVRTEANSSAASLLDTVGPHIRSAMLKGGYPLTLAAGDEVSVVAVGPSSSSWEGGRDEASKEVRIGCSYVQLCSHVAPGKHITISDGSGAIWLEVVRVVNETVVLAKVVRGGVLGQCQRMSLPGLKPALPLFSDADGAAMRALACAGGMDFVAVGNLRTPADVQQVRQLLDAAGGQLVQIVAKIDNRDAVEHVEDILPAVAGILISRSDLALELPLEAVTLAQKMLTAKAAIAGRFAIVSGAVMNALGDSHAASRQREAEMSDLANAVFDGADCLVLGSDAAPASHHTPATSACTPAAISGVVDLLRAAESASCLVSTATCILERQPHHRVPAAEMVAQSVPAACRNSSVAYIVTVSSTGSTANLVAKYRPGVPQIVVSASGPTCRRAAAVFGQLTCRVETLAVELPALLQSAQRVAKAAGLLYEEGHVLAIVGETGVDADACIPVMRIIS
ncbi:hypothetical protein WJX72_001077 [[Myrmecia] bisecta]|uniref:Pyruvate kinase n=1 Tax=[Myrmecia] bisecta TaxID=41462 RepID=A0AAW1PS47_9CHLO